MNRGHIMAQAVGVPVGPPFRRHYTGSWYSVQRQFLLKIFKNAVFNPIRPGFLDLVNNQNSGTCILTPVGGR